MWVEEEDETHRITLVLDVPWSIAAMYDDAARRALPLATRCATRESATPIIVTNVLSLNNIFREKGNFQRCVHWTPTSHVPTMHTAHISAAAMTLLRATHPKKTLLGVHAQASTKARAGSVEFQLCCLHHRTL